MQKRDGTIEIGKNCVRYNDEVLKISNISRTWIFRFRNREKMAFKKAEEEYRTAKARYIMFETDTKIRRRNKYIIATIIVFLASMFLFQASATVGAVVLIGAAICGNMAYRIATKSVVYDIPPPEEGTFPDKYGLGIEMNSSYTAVFTAIGNEGAQALRKLQEEINDADTQGGISIFNMNENHISVENNEGIISTGDNANNDIKEKES